MRHHAILSSLFAVALSLVHAHAAAELFSKPGSCRMHGVATVYHSSLHGLKTASGESYDRQGLTAAHRTLPIGTKVLVTNLQNLKQVLVRINDRGPFAPGKMLDLSSAAAERLGMTRPGKMQVQIALSADALASAQGPSPARSAAQPQAGRPAGRLTAADADAPALSPSEIDAPATDQPTTR